MKPYIFICFFLFAFFVAPAQDEIRINLDSAAAFIQKEQRIPAYLYCLKALSAAKKLPSDNLEIKYNTYLEYIKSVNEIIQNINISDHQRLFYTAEYEAYETAIDLGYQLFKKTGDQEYVKQTFELAERNRNVLFIQTLRGAENLNFGGIPDSTLAREGSFIVKIKAISDSLNTYKKHIQLHKKRIDDLEAKLEEIETDFSNFQLSTQKRYANYTMLNQRNKTASIPEIQKSLKKQEAFIEYFYGEQFVYAFLITKTTVQYFKLNSVESILGLVNNFKKNLHHQEKKFIHTSGILYHKLFQPFENHLNSIKKITIIPDGALSYLPFEAFIKTVPNDWDYDFSTLSYLIKEYQFAYHQSAKSFLNPKIIKARPKEKILSLVPLFNKKIKNTFLNPSDSVYNQLNELSNSLSLFNTVNRYYQTKTLLGKEANLINFAKYFNAPIIHLATHTLINEEAPLESKIAFVKSDSTDSGYYYLKDLYQISLNSELVILGSCETGRGTFSKGEGMVSLAYGFDLAGAASTVYSLWKVDEDATIDLMKYFYANLKKGQSKDLALHQAKMQYLKQANEVESSPFYWAAFVFNGDILPIQNVQTSHYFRNYYLKLVGMLSVVVMAIGFGFYYFKNRKSNI